jgi:formylglycine-generating enzyme required for sulfatase activity
VNKLSSTSGCSDCRLTSAHGPFGRVLRALVAVLALAVIPAAHGQTACDADTNSDGVVDSADLGALLSAWGACESCAADINDDGVVDSADLGALLSLWNEVCEPSGWSTVLEAAPDPAVVTNAALRDAILASGHPWRVRDNLTQIEMVLVPAGTFQMGCLLPNPIDCFGGYPVRTVTLSQPFYIGRYEVTQAEWTARAGSNPSSFRSPSDEVPSEQVPNRPVESVSWNSVQAFLSGTGLRLPTEAEWEYAYRAGTTTRYHSMPGFPDGTDDIGQVGAIAWYYSNSSIQPRPVGQKAANAFGLFDMSGNVEEWCSDWDSPSYDGPNPVTDPTGAVTGGYRSTRGGSFRDSHEWLAASTRWNGVPDSWSSSTGFRVARRVTGDAPTVTAITPNEAPPEGIAITITGTNLTGTHTVVIGTRPARDVTVVNDNTVMAIAPPQVLGTRDVIVGGRNGVVYIPNGFTVAIPRPTIASVSPSTGGIAGGTTILISGTNFTGASTVTVGGNAATNIAVLNSGTIRATAPAGAVGSVAVTVTTPGGTATRAGGFTYVESTDPYQVIEQDPNPAIVTNAAMRAAIVASGLPWRVRDIGTQIEMVLVPAGTFSMGCSPSDASACVSDEVPVHTVTISKPFYLGRYEVTQAQWASRMGSNPSQFQGDGYPDAATRPVERVSWNMIQGFLDATGLRLPTEAEWEFAYRAGTTTAFHSMPGFENGTNESAQVGTIGWFIGNAGGQTRPVGQKAPNALGLSDMSGNVWEWVNDWYDSGYYTSSPATDPQGPATGSSRVLRGGSWTWGSERLRASARGATAPANAFNDFGFRVVRNPYAQPTVASVSPQGGSQYGGTLITIIGNNLAGTTSVTVGGVAATNVTVVDASTVTALTPAGTLGATSVVLTTPGGVVTIPGGFRYQITPEWATVLEAWPDASVVPNESRRGAILGSNFPWRVRDNATQIEMLLIPAGTFQMGCEEELFANGCAGEELRHPVTISKPFYIGRYEVTQAEWTARMGSNPSHFQSPSDEVPVQLVPRRPVENISWQQAQGFLAAAGLRLPTEAEWEYAYRAGTTTAWHSMPGFPEGTNDEFEVDAIAWFGRFSFESDRFTRPFGLKAANGFGLHDMAGNVSEWVNDWFGSYESSTVPQVDPTGPASGLHRVFRGGDFSSSAPYFVRASSRASSPPEDSIRELGFRAARNAIPVPTVGSVTPSSGTTEGGTTITVTGTGFETATVVTIDGVEASSVTVVSPNTITAVTPAGASGAKNVVVTNPAGGGVLAGGFTYVVPVPTLASVSPSSGTTLGGTTITLTGTKLTDTSSVTIGGNPATSVTVVNSTTVTAVTPAGPAGARDVAVTTPGGTATAPGAFTYVLLVPTITSVSPTSGTTAGGTTITITGTNLTGASSVTVGGNPATSVTVVNSTTVTAVTPAGAAGARDVAVTTPGGTATLPNAFTYVVPAPTLASVSPSSGTTLGGTAITLTGTNLTGASLVTVGGNPATSVTVVNATTVTAVTPVGAAGSAAVALTTPGGTATLANAFTYVVPAPTISSVSPIIGTAAGGTTITITGTNLTGASSVTVGGNAATSVTVVNATTVTAVTPAGTAGARTVAVTTPGGTATAAGAFTYITVPSWATALELLPDPAVVTNATLRNAIIATNVAWRVRDNATQIEMLLVPAGTYSMGCSPSNTNACFPQESPVHSVTLTQPFYLGRYEVTQAQWTARMGSNPSFFQSASANVPAAQVPNRPVERVSMNTIQTFLSGTGLRLPTEAEWEYAYRAGTTTAYHSMPAFPNGTNDSAQVGTIAWFNGNAGSETRPVGGKAANALGIHDMGGNVWEWLSDWYSSTYYASSPPTDPQGPATGSVRVLRGGSWLGPQNDARASYRGADGPAAVTNEYGFRVARNVFLPP